MKTTQRMEVYLTLNCTGLLPRLLCPSLVPGCWCECGFIWNTQWQVYGGAVLSRVVFFPPCALFYCIVPHLYPHAVQRDHISFCHLTSYHQISMTPVWLLWQRFLDIQCMLIKSLSYNGPGFLYTVTTFSIYWGITINNKFICTLWDKQLYSNISGDILAIFL